MQLKYTLSNFTSNSVVTIMYVCMCMSGRLYPTFKRQLLNFHKCSYSEQHGSVQTVSAKLRLCTTAVYSYVGKRKLDLWIYGEVLLGGLICT